MQSARNVAFALVSLILIFCQHGFVFFGEKQVSTGVEENAGAIVDSKIIIILIIIIVGVRLWLMMVRPRGTAKLGGSRLAAAREAGDEFHNIRIARTGVLVS